MPGYVGDDIESVVAKLLQVCKSKKSLNSFKKSREIVVVLCHLRLHNFDHGWICRG